MHGGLGKRLLQQGNAPNSRKKNKIVGLNTKKSEKHVCLQCMELHLQGKRDERFTSICRLDPSSLRSRRYSRAQGEKLEIPPAQKLSILSSAHRAHGSAHTNVFALENQSERELLIMLLAGLQCSKRCQFNNCFVFFCHGEQNNSHETFVKAYTVNIVLLPTPLGKIAITSVYQATNVGLIYFAHTSSRWVDR